MFIQKPDFLCSHLRSSSDTKCFTWDVLLNSTVGGQDNAITLANIPATEHGVAKLQFTWHRSDLQFKFPSARHYYAGIAGLVVVNGG